MQCVICRATFRLTAYNRTDTCQMCQVNTPQEPQDDEDLELEYNLMTTQGRTLAVFDSDVYSSCSDIGNDYEDYGHGL